LRQQTAFPGFLLAAIRYLLSDLTTGAIAMQQRALKTILIIAGLLFVATAYPMLAMDSSETLQMMLSIYVTLGIFLLLAARNPAAHRSLIAFAAWSSIAHAGVMAFQSLHDVAERIHLLAGTAAFLLIGAALITFAPRSPSTAAV
jgi:drug/metabolite transporter superfamily protein YnfA